MKKNKIGLCFGVWDLFHEGHRNLLTNAKKQCDTLIVCVSDSEYSLEHKNKIPINMLYKRKKDVSDFKSVDGINVQSLIFGKKEAIEKYKPDVLFVGDDHINDYTGEGLGVPVVYLTYTKGISSTILRKRLNK